MTQTFNVIDGPNGWAPNSAVNVGYRVQNGSNLYQVIGAGMTSSGGGPTGTGSNIQDGTAFWKYLTPIDNSTSVASFLSGRTLFDDTVVQIWCITAPGSGSAEISYSASMWFNSDNTTFNGHRLKITAAPGESICDNLGNNALWYNANLGLAYRITAAGSWNTIGGSNGPFIIDRIQFYMVNFVQLLAVGSGGAWLTNCICLNDTGNGIFWADANDAGMINCVLISLLTDNSAGRICSIGKFETSGYGRFIGCTFINVYTIGLDLIDLNPNPAGWDYVQNNLWFGEGASDIIQGQNSRSGNDGVTYSYNVGDQPNLGYIGDQGNNKINIGAASVFVNPSGDLRLRSGSPAIGAATTSPNWPPAVGTISTDITGHARGSTWDAGAWQYRVVATVTGISLSNTTVLANQPTGTVVGSISVTMSSGTFAGSLSVGGTNAASFAVSGTNLVTSSSLSAGSYSVTLTATPSDTSISPFTSTPFAITVQQINAPTGNVAYYLEESSSASGPWTAVAGSPFTSTTDVVSGLTQSTLYYFRLSALDVVLNIRSPYTIFTGTTTQSSIVESPQNTRVSTVAGAVPAVSPILVTSATGSTLNVAWAHPSAVIYDAALNDWTMVNSGGGNGVEVAKNGTPITATQLVQLLAYWTHTVYYRAGLANRLGVNPGWWYLSPLSGTDWLPFGGDPVSTTSPQQTDVTDTVGQIVNTQGTWKLSASGQVVLNGSADSNTSGTTEILLWGSNVYRNTGGVVPGAVASLTSPSQSNTSVTVAWGQPTSGATLDNGVYTVQQRLTGTTNWTTIATLPYCTPGRGSYTDAFGNIWAINSSNIGTVNGQAGGGTVIFSILVAGTVNVSPDGTTWYYYTPTGTITDGNVLWGWSSTTTSPLAITATGLTQNTSYDFRVNVSNSNGSGPFAAITQSTANQTGSGIFRTTSATDYILAPDGSRYMPQGVNVFGQEHLSSGLWDASTGGWIFQAFPKTNFIRIFAANQPPTYPYPTAAQMMAFHTYCANRKVVVMWCPLEGTDGNWDGLTGYQMTSWQNWINNEMSQFKGNPYVWFESRNEPFDADADGYTRAQYNIIRNAGITSPFVSGYNDRITTWAPYSNIVLDFHPYNNNPPGLDTASYISNKNGYIAGWQSVGRTAEGYIIPCGAFEFGDSGAGNNTFDDNWQGACQAVISRQLNAFGWAAFCTVPPDFGTAGDQLNHGNQANNVGLIMQQYML